MIPEGSTIRNAEIEEEQQPSKTWLIDFEKGRVVGKTEGLDAVKQTVFKILHTERFEYLIYSPDYGMETNGLIGQSPVFVQSELKRRIREALTQDDRIEDVQDFQFDINGDAVTVRFRVVSQEGTFEETFLAGEVA